MKKRLLMTCVLAALPVVSDAETTLDYASLARRLHTLEHLASPPVPGERSGNFSSFDRASRYLPDEGRYEQWGANNDGRGFIRQEGKGIVVAEMDGPGVIWRIWTAAPGGGAMKIHIDGSAQPTLAIPFAEFFKRNGAEWPELVHVISKGHNSFIPIPYEKSCKIVFDPGWGQYYQFTYSTFPKGTVLPSFRGKFDTEEKAALAAANAALAKRGEWTLGAGQEVSDKTVVIEPGSSVEVFSVTGNRAIRRIEYEPDPQDENPVKTLRELTLAITWDNAADPAVWAPLGDFFGSAPGINRFHALPMGMSRERFYSNWFMPFSKAARITVTNDGALARPVKFRVVHEPLPIPGEKLLRFHAKWHRNDFSGVDRERFTKGDRWPDWPVLVTQGTGRFCGMNLHVWNPNPFGKVRKELDVDPGEYPEPILELMRTAAAKWWWGEGDEKFFVDGEPMPSTFGTGTEDYFGYAWAAHNPVEFESAYQNQPLNKNSNLGHISNNRFQIADNVPFQSRCEAVLEKYHPDNWPLLYACTAYWYQQPTAAVYGPVPVTERVDYHVQPEKRVLVPRDCIYEGARHFTLAAGARVQDMKPFGKQWRGDAQLLWGGEPGASAQLSFQVLAEITARARLQLTEAPDYGVFEIQLDGKTVATGVDCYAPSVRLAPPLELGEVKLGPGTHTLNFKIAGANAAARKYRGSQYLLGVVYLDLGKPERP